MRGINIPIQKIIEDDLEHTLLFQSILCKLGNHVQDSETNLVFITKKKQGFFQMRN